jgi:hypothetical protein
MSKENIHKGHNDPQPQHGNDDKGHQPHRGGDHVPAKSHSSLTISCNKSLKN